jgi:soluble lytic murein transglycosylase-like protein
MISQRNCGVARDAALIKQATAEPATLLRIRRELAATFAVAAGALFAPGIMAAELNEHKHQATIHQLESQTPSLAPDKRPVEHLRFKWLERRSLLKAEKEAKIHAQTQYLVAKFRRSELAIRKFVELAWKEASKRNGVPPELLIAVMQKESSLRPSVESHYGAQGLMQVVRRWHPDKLLPSESLFDPEVNIRVGAAVLEEYLDHADGSLTTALAKYSGNARGYATRVLSESYKLAHVAAEAVSQVVPSTASRR